jgi:iron complex outermembrane recepter protein
LKATLGLRYYNYSNSVCSTVSGLARETGTTAFFLRSGSEPDHGVNTKFDLSYTSSDDLLMYTTASKGFRPGGGNEPLPTGPTDLGDACAAALAALGGRSATPYFKPDTV